MNEQVIRPSAPASGRLTPASFPFYTTGEDNLRVTSWNSAAGVVLTINARTITAAGQVMPDSWTHTPNTDRSAKTSDLTLSGTTLLNIIVFASAGAPLVGQCFVKIELIRGIGTAALVLGVIVQGPVTAKQSLGFPGSPILYSTDGEPIVRNITGSASASTITETVPTGARWELVTIASTHTRGGAIVAGPYYLFLDDGTNVLGYFAGGQSGGPGTTNFVGFGEGNLVASLAISGGQVCTGPSPSSMRLAAGSRIRITNGSLGAGDSFAAPHYTVREWLDV